MVIQHNMASLFTQRQLGITTGIKEKSSEKLSSGYRINRAADDAAGLAISEKMRRQIRGLSQNLDNVQEGVSFCQVADGYLNEVHDLLQRISELCVKAANDTLTDEDREYVNQEVQQDKYEIERIFDTARYNEMRIFKMPYTPSVVSNPEPYDTEIFYSSPGVIGGLEFNNIRYTLSELGSAGMRLDSNGVATADQTVNFNLYNGELVSLSLKQGQTLRDVVRNYKWTADGNGIYVNNVLAATWGSMGVSDGENYGDFSFDFRGMTINFSVEDGDVKQDIIDAINGTALSPPAYWSNSVSSGTARSVAQLSNSRTLTATNANANVFDHQYAISATEGGLAIADVTAGTTNSRLAWSSFANVGGAIPRTPAEPDAASSGYPIVDFGVTDYTNSAAGITFDSEALYRYTSPDSTMPFQYNFRLNDTSSRGDVLNAMNVGFSTSINCPATLTLGSTSDGSAFSVTSSPITANNLSAFAIQRAYGRDFDTNAAISGNVNWTSTAVSGSERILATTNTNTYKTASNSTSTDNGDYYYQDANGNIRVRKGETQTVTTEDWHRDGTYIWAKDYLVTYDGTLNGIDMQDQTETVTITGIQSGELDWTETSTTYTWDEDYELTGSELAEVQRLIAEGSIQVQSEANTDDFSSTQGTETITNVMVAGGELEHSGSFADGSGNTAFSFAHKISYATIANEGTGSKSINVGFDGAVTRTFTPIQRGNTVTDYDFNNIVVHPPEKRMVIQATPDSPITEQIVIEWHAMNLGVIGAGGINTLTSGAARGGIDLVKNAMKTVSEERGIFGASQNRCEHAYKQIGVTRENTQHSESVIRDTEMAGEYSRYSAHSILEQAGQAMLAQANQTNQGVLSLLQ